MIIMKPIPLIPLLSIISLEKPQNVQLRYTIVIKKVY